ncbi:unnamed protein product [Orchesella dallaii]|uniref:Carrier domain-containing protein n=1 Tax=Orchesella dallaii TaxID=48710 RepID=A0ABP1S1W2_9HEXA
MLWKHDIEKDPMKQGFPPGYFDIVVGVDVFHATRNLNNTLKNIQILTRKNGMVIAGETDIPTKELDIVFGILDGYWLFDDNIRSSHCTISADKWIDLLRENGFRDSLCKIFATNNQMSVITGRLSESYNHVDTKNDDINIQEWLIIHDDRNEDALKSFLSQMRNYRRSVQLVSLNSIADEILQGSLENYLYNILESQKLNLEGILYLVEGCDSFIQQNCRLLLEPLLVISKQLMQLKLKTMPKFHIATKGVWWNGDENVINQYSPSSGSLWGYMRNARIEIPGLKSKSIDLDPDDNLYTNLFEEMWLEDSETEILYRNNGTRYVRRLRNDTLNTTRLLSVPTSQENKYTIKLPESKVLSDLEFIPKEFGKVGENKIEIEVQCASLNFKDVFTVMKPSKEFENMNNIGLDYSGVVSSVGSEVTRWKVGDRVFGCCWEDSTITSHLFLDPDFVMPIPNNVTFSEAATLPAVFLTAWHCMVNVANLRPGQSILVHAASGGVGLIAIQIAKLLGVTVFGTAGSTRKRNFIKNLGVEHVFSSRNLEFGSRIQEITKGQGVDMILNCLTGPGFKEASLEVCREGGFFVEISKLDIWQPEEVRHRKPSVKYNIVDVMQVEPVILQDIMERLTRFLEGGTIQPLPYTRFSGSTIVDALTYLQKAKQIGKVIVDMPRFDTKESRFREYLFNDRSTYLITGGKGAIGLSVAKWMVSQGAKYLVLVGRSPPKEETLKEISFMQDLGAKVICKEVDISDYSQCKNMLDSITNDNLPPVRGIHHCSGVLSDKMIAHQDWNNFEYVLAPKVSGAYNLHLLTTEYPLEFFVVYSSMATTFGNIGQANYAASNAYMDSLIEMRNALGLKGMTVNWGVWKAGLAENIELDWADSFSINQGINALHRFFQQNRIASVAGNVKFNEIIKMTPYFEKTLLEDIDLVSTRSGSSRSRGRLTDNGKEPRKINFVELYSKTEGEEGKQATALKFVVDILCETLGVKEHEVNVDVNFQDMGMDSLLSIEFTNKLQSELGDVTLGFVDMEVHGSVPKMTELIQSILQSQTSS